MRSLALVFLLPACGSEAEPTDEPQRILDMSGAEFFWTGDDVHRIAGVSPVPPVCTEGTADYKLLRGSPFGKIAGGCIQEHGFAGWYGNDRIIVCDVDDDCPIGASRPYECRAGLCRDVDHSGVMVYTDAFSLCYGHEPRSDDFNYWSHHDSELWNAVEDICPSPGFPEPCTGPLPPECRDPG